MSENKGRFNPWVPTVILGVVAVLFSFYALQSQTDLQDARKEIERLENQTATCAKESERQQQQDAETLKQMTAACENAKKQADEACKKVSKK